MLPLSKYSPYLNIYILFKLASSTHRKAPIVHLVKFLKINYPDTIVKKIHSNTKPMEKEEEGKDRGEGSDMIVNEHHHWQNGAWIVSSGVVELL